MPKIRLYRGPFDGKVLTDPHGFRESFFHVGMKKMTREQEYKWRMSEEYQRALIWQDIGNNRQGGRVRMAPGPRPLIRAEYRRKIIAGCIVDGHVFSSMPCMHPDGSVFYEWTGYSQPFSSHP